MTTEQTISAIGEVASVAANVALSIILPPTAVKTIIEAFVKYGPEVAQSIAKLFASKEGATLQEIIDATTLPDYESFGIKDVAQRDASKS